MTRFDVCQTGGIGATIEDLADILVAADAAGVPRDRLGVCLDTAHLGGAGYDIRYSRCAVQRRVEGRPSVDPVVR